MEEIIEPISKELLKAELTEEKRLRMTNKSHNQIYIITAQDSPNIMREIGRLREIAFRAAGGGTGKPLDIDEYDIMENPYKQKIQNHICDTGGNDHDQSKFWLFSCNKETLKHILQYKSGHGNTA